MSERDREINDTLRNRYDLERYSKICPFCKIIAYSPPTLLSIVLCNLWGPRVLLMPDLRLFTQKKYINI